MQVELDIPADMVIDKEKLLAGVHASGMPQPTWLATYHTPNVTIDYTRPYTRPQSFSVSSIE